MTLLRFVLLLVTASIFCAGAPATGPLRVSRDNPRYLADAEGRVVLLTGSHTWDNLLDISPSDPPAAFDFPAYLDWLAKYNHNFMRLWTWELSSWNTEGNSPGNRTRVQVHTVTPLRWARTGPGAALDGKPKFDLSRFDAEYFERLRSRVQMASERGIYVSVMLFEGWGLQRIPHSWEKHPMHPANNINGVDGDANGDGLGVEVHELGQPEVTAIQEAYVRKVVDTLNAFDNVLYEISNENHPASTEWQYHMIRYVRDYERQKPKQHPIGMTFQFEGGSNRTLQDSPADWISPNWEGGYRDDPPPADGHKVILTDTDHLWGIGGSVDWVWKSFTRGLNPLFMDPYDGVILSGRPDLPAEAIRRAMGQTLELVRRVDLARLTPHGELSSSRYCLADPGREYIAYMPGGGTVSIDLGGEPGAYSVEWIHPVTGRTVGGSDLSDGRHLLTAPFGAEAVLHLTRR